ncbi:MAG: hypothetical protein Q4A62_05930 [Eikenella sp.]|nr:hypothetical protein [Eikenella sp.]
MIKTVKQVCLLVAAGWLAACSPQPQAGVYAAEASAAADGRDAVWGLYTYGHEVSVFAPCGGTQDFWADGGEAVMKPLQEASMRLAESRNMPYQAVLARLYISEPVQAAEGFPADYDAAVTVKAVADVLPDRQSCPE